MIYALNGVASPACSCVRKLVDDLLNLQPGEQLKRIFFYQSGTQGVQSQSRGATIDCTGGVLIALEKLAGLVRTSWLLDANVVFVLFLLRVTVCIS